MIIEDESSSDAEITLVAYILLTIYIIARDKRLTLSRYQAISLIPRLPPQFQSQFDLPMS
jgi:hypothetical protein